MYMLLPVLHGMVFEFMVRYKASIFRKKIIREKIYYHCNVVWKNSSYYKQTNIKVDGISVQQI